MRERSKKSTKKYRIWFVRCHHKRRKNKEKDRIVLPESGNTIHMIKRRILKKIVMYTKVKANSDVSKKELDTYQFTTIHSYIDSLLC